MPVFGESVEGSEGGEGEEFEGAEEEVSGRVEEEEDAREPFGPVGGRGHGVGGGFECVKE